MHIELITILNRCHRVRGFVYQHACFSADGKSIEVAVRSRKGSAAVCSRCHFPAPGYDQLAERRFEFIPAELHIGLHDDKKWKLRDPIMMTMDTEEPLAVATVKAIQKGDVDELKRLLNENPDLATARLRDPSGGGISRALLHVATDWPGNFPNGAATVSALIAYGADVNTRFTGPHTETPLHWAASSDDVSVLDALLDSGADIEAPGAVIAGGTPLADAVAFGQWKAARRLIERGAETTLGQAAALGLIDRVKDHLAKAGAPTQEEITRAFWSACHGGQRETAEYLLGRGADLNWIGWDSLTPIEAASRSGARELVDWLRSQGAQSASF